ncbi:MAG: carboxypeptidase M32 [Candidatus Hodarchaeota archaeon]
MKINYTNLIEIYKEIYLLNSLSGVLYWDLNTGKVPTAGLNYRTQQFNWIQRQIHKKITSDQTRKLLSLCEKDETLNPIKKRNVLLLRREFDNNTVIPEGLIGELATQSSKTLEIWKKAKVKNQFHYVLPDLVKLFSLNVRKAEFLAKMRGLIDPYEALINTRDPGITVELLTKIFNEIKRFLKPFVIKCQNSSIQADISFLSRKVPRKVQIKLVHDLATFLGYDDKISEVEHPLTIACGPHDARVTVKYHEDQIMKAFSSCAHECGHALHSLQRNPSKKIDPVRTISYPSHGESQSRFIENVICKSQEFWHFYYPRFQEITRSFNDIKKSDFYFAINKVKPSYIRMAADEVTYVLHIIVRFEIERDLFAGKLEVKDLPQVWNEKYKEYLGVDVPNDELGLMQDLHWYSQYWGYFFGYALGDIMNAQITEILTKDFPSWKSSLYEGNFVPINQWIAKNVHEKGVMFDSLDMIKEISNKPLSARFFIKYLKCKYSSLYQL